jgi:hypothetical protein
MKKLWLVSALSLGLVLLAGCNTPTSQVTINSSDDMISMYEDAHAITCNLAYSDWVEEWTSVMYIKDGMISQETKSTSDWEEVTMYTVAKDGKMYVWGNVYGEWGWMSVTYDMDINEELQWFDDVDENTTVKCSKGVKSDSVFELPTNIEFTSMDDLLNYWDDTYYEVEENVEDIAEEINEEVTEEVTEEVAEEVNE